MTIDNFNCPLISILVPIYNVEPYIEQCARSLFAQTYPNIEFLFLDDCSTDHSIEVLNRVIGDYPSLQGRIQILRHERNLGNAASRDDMIWYCKGEFLIHVDSDDWVEPDMTESLYRRQLETNADIVSARVMAHNGDRQYEFCDSGINLSREDALLALVAHRISYSAFRRLYRTSVIKDNGIRYYRDIRIHDDLQTIPRIFYYAKSIAWLDAYVYHYRVNRSSISFRLMHNYDLQNARLNAIRKHIEFFSDKGDALRDAVQKFIMKEITWSNWLALAGKHRDLYDETIRLLDSVDSRHWHMIGWNHWLKRWLDHHYHLSRLVFPIRDYRQNMLRKKTCN